MGTPEMTKTTGKEYFYKVPGLMVPGYMIPAGLESDIERFIDWVSNNAGALESLAENEDLIRGPHAFLHRMQRLYVMLCSIHAGWLEREAARILRMADASEVEICRALAVPFVANMHTLALDIQMAQNGKLEKSYKCYGEIESYRDIISGAKLISMLLQNSNFEKALDVAESIGGLRESSYSARLKSSITSKSSEAEKLADEIVYVYTKKIDAILSGAPIPASPASPASSPKELDKKKILLVDDMPEILVTLSYMLEDYYQVISFTSGAEALDYLTKNRADAFILDIDMPGMDGFTLAKKIREKARQKDSPILFLTGNSTREILVKALTYAPKAFIVKPANKNVIISKLNECLQA